MSLINLPKTNQTGTNEWNDVQSNDDAIVAVVNGDLDNTNLSGSAAITDANLASPNNAAYRTVTTASGFMFAYSAGTYLLGSSLITPLNGNDISLSGGDTSPPEVITLTAADYAVSGKTTKLRVRGTVATNSVAPAATFTFGLYPLSSISGGTMAMGFTLGSVVAGSTAAVISPSANAAPSTTGADFTFPASSPYPYMLGVVVSGQIAANSTTALYAHLQVRNV